MKFWILSFLLIITFQLSAQTTVQWASKVINYSTELTGLQYSADQILEKPNILPSGGDNPNAWNAYKNNLLEFIKVGFDLPMPIVQIAIAESHNPGAITHVYLYDEKGAEYLVYEKTPGPIREPWRMNNIYMDLTPYNVEAIKIVVDGASVDGFNAIDAIGMSNSIEPITAEINLMLNINKQVKGRTCCK